MCALRPDAGVEPGVLLVASPMLGDSELRRTVVYVLDHRPDGSVGVVLNRPSDVTLLDVLPQWFDLASAPRTLFVGGPVETNAALCLGEVRNGIAAARLDRGVRTGRADRPRHRPGGVERDLHQVRVFAGYAGWGAGQLAGEIADGAWLVVAGHAVRRVRRPRRRPVAGRAAPAGRQRRADGELSGRPRLN